MTNVSSFSQNYDERAIFVSKPRDTQGNLFNVMYHEPSTNEKLYLQGVFPIINGTIDHGQAYARVGPHREHRTNIGSVVPLSAIASSSTCGKRVKPTMSSPVPCPR